MRAPLEPDIDLDFFIPVQGRVFFKHRDRYLRILDLAKNSIRTVIDPDAAKTKYLFPLEHYTYLSKCDGIVTSCDQ